MAEEIDKFNLNRIQFLENSTNIKKEFEDDSYIGICKTSFTVDDAELNDRVWNAKEYKIAITEGDIKMKLLSEASDIVIHDNVKIEKEISADDIKMEFDSRLLLCDNCDEHYEDYCTKCGMLTHILNGINLNNADGRATKEIPNDILEIRESPGRVEVIALKVIPESVKIGPFNGLCTSECPLRLKGGKFLVTEDKEELFNWMWHINPARDIFQQNLIPFRCEDRLYYHSSREILPGEELLVYFGEEYEDSVNEDFEMDFIASVKDDVRDVFGCTLCCLGFSTKAYLAKHKSCCPKEMKEKCSIDELTQCPFCKIHIYETEYLEFHKPFCCCGKSDRKYFPLASDNQAIDVKRRKTRRLQMYNCNQCKYKTTYKGDLKSHVNKHYEVKLYRCEVCCRQFKTKASLILHAKNIHVDVGAKEYQNCSTRGYIEANRKAGSSKVYHYARDKAKQYPKCKFQIKNKYHLEAHAKTERLKKFSYDCEICGYKTNRKFYLKVHINTKHLKEFNYECELCDYKTNHKFCLDGHIKSIHLREFSHACEICDYKTNKKWHFERHLKSKHLKEFNYKCEMCDYKTHQNSDLKKHIKSKHLKEFSYKCEMCDYKAHQRPYLENHMKSKHLKQFSYECEMCDYKTNYKRDLEKHIKSVHLKEFSHVCELCDFKTNYRRDLDEHIKSVHLREFSYECELCDFKTNKKWRYEKHIKAKHLKEFNYECKMCNYKTHQKSDLGKHIKSKHLKEFSYHCEICDYKTHQKSYLARHIKAKHLKE